MYAIIATGGKQYKVSEGDIITIVTALFFSISISDLGVRNDGLIAVMITKRTIKTTASSASREPVIFFMTDFFSIIQHPLYVLFPLRVQGFFPV